MITLQLIKTCAPDVAPSTIQNIIGVESGWNPLAVHVNPKSTGSKRQRLAFHVPIQIRTAQDAVSVAYAAINAGHTVDLGYMQVNSANLNALGFSVEDMFDTCKNLKAGAIILGAFYRAARLRYPEDQTALHAALSAYNTGSFRSGFANGYLARYGLENTGSHPSVSAFNPYMAATAIFVRRSSQKQKESILNTAQSPEYQLPKSETDAQAPRVDPVISRSLSDGGTPGVQIEHSPEEAERLGYFHEQALSEEDAWAANADIGRDPDNTAVVMHGKNVRRRS